MKPLSLDREVAFLCVEFENLIMINTGMHLIIMGFGKWNKV